MVCQMELGKRLIIMAMSIKDILSMDKDKGMERILSTRFIDIKVSGKIIVFQVKESYSEMDKYFLKEFSKTV